MQRARGVGRAAAGGAVEDQLGGAVRRRALDARLQMAPRNALGAGQVTGGELFAAAHVHDRHALVDQLVHLGGIDLVDLALDLAEQLRA